MPIEVRWENEDRTVLYQVFSDPWDIEEYLVAVQQALHMVQGVTHTVYHILDFAHTYSVPDNAIRHFSRIGRQIIPLDHVVVMMVNVNSMLREIAQVIHALLPEMQRYPILDTLADAYNIIDHIYI